jgi:hypothetical protein
LAVVPPSQAGQRQAAVAVVAVVAVVVVVVLVVAVTAVQPTSWQGRHKWARRRCPATPRVWAWASTTPPRDSQRTREERCHSRLPLSLLLLLPPLLLLALVLAWVLRLQVLPRQRLLP